MLDSPQQPPSDPRIEEMNIRWEEFRAEGFEGQIALFMGTLSEPELMDGDTAFEMLNIIYGRSVERGEQDRFDGLVERLRERLPDVYATNAPYLLKWRIVSALATDRLEAVTALVHEMAMIADRDIDIFDNILDMLAYHGQLPLLAAATHLAWPSVKDSSAIVPWGIDHFARQAANYAVFDRLDGQASLDPGDPELLEELEVYFKMHPGRFPRYVAHLTGEVERCWTLDDFELAHYREPSGGLLDELDEFAGFAEKNMEGEVDQDLNPGRQNLFHLTVEFLGYLRREEGVPYPKGELAREQILQYILNRYDGELEPRESPLEALMRPGKRKAPKRKASRPDHLLCPDHSTLEHFLAQLLHFVNPQRYKAAATFELVPSWLRFLESRQLIDAQQRKKTLYELQGLDSELLKIWKRYPDDPALQREMERWREQRA